MLSATIIKLIKLFTSALLLFFLIGCKSSNDNIDDIYPKGSILNYTIFEKAEQVMLDPNYYILQVNSKYGTEYYRPYLLFFSRKNLELELSVYNPGKVISIKNKTVTGAFNNYRSEKMKMQLENGYNFLFEQSEPNPVSNEFEGKVLKYILKNDSLTLKVRDSVNLKKVTYCLNQIVFPEYDQDEICVYFLTDKSLRYKYYDISQSELKSTYGIL